MTSDPAARPRIYESIIKVVVDDPKIRRARDIAEGLGYACALLQDEYGWTAEAIREQLEMVADEIEYQEEQREGRA